MAAKLAGGGGAYALKQNAEINVTPFVDILLVLLIIFMVSVPMAVTSIKVDMPPAANLPAPQPPVFISIQTSGALFLGDEPTRLETLGQDLGARFAADGQTGPRRDQKVMIRAQADVPYETFMAVLDRVHAQGWTRVGVINEEIR
jgi:biopolymer transport protein ExbD